MDVITDASEEILATYNLCLIGPASERGPAHSVGIAKETLAEIEENLTDLLPEGFRVQIKEWDSE